MKKSFLYCLFLVIITSACSKHGDDGPTIDPFGRPAAGTKNEIRTEGDRGLLIDPNGRTKAVNGIYHGNIAIE